jgi:uncharacterized protein (TIGR02217 family)
MAQLLAFFEARRGQLFGFRWKDWSDYKSSSPSTAITHFDQRIGVGDGVTRVFRLAKTYRSGEAFYVRPIIKPVVGTVLAAIADTPKVEDQDFTVDPLTGTITFIDAPDIGVTVSAGFEFDVPVRFDADRIQTSVGSFKAGDVPNVPVIEVRVA